MRETLLLLLDELVFQMDKDIVNPHPESVLVARLNLRKAIAALAAPREGQAVLEELLIKHAPRWTGVGNRSYIHCSACHEWDATKDKAIWHAGMAWPAFANHLATVLAASTGEGGAQRHFSRAPTLALPVPLVSIAECIWLKVVFSGPSWKIGVCMFVAKMLSIKTELYAGGNYQDPRRAAPEQLGEKG